MRTLKSVLVPVDFSAVARNAYDFALRLADLYPARVDLLYCMPNSLSSPGMDRIMVARGSEMKTEAEENMVNFRRSGIDDAINHLTGIPEVCSIIESGDMEDIIKKRIENGEADIVIMGTTGTEKPLSGLVGTNTTYLIDQATVPVLIVPNESGYRPVKKICYATDLKHLDAFQVSNLFDLFAPYQPTVEFVHVAGDNGNDTEYNLSLLRKVVDRPQYNDRLLFTRLNGTDEVEEILAYMNESGADLLVMNRPQRSWLDRLLKRSHTREAMLKSEAPLLILHHAEI